METLKLLNEINRKLDLIIEFQNRQSLREKQNTLNKIDKIFIKYFDTYFRQERNLGMWIPRTELYNEFMDTKTKPNCSAQVFKINLEHYCNLQNWKIESKKIAIKIFGGSRKATEHFRIKK